MNVGELIEYLKTQDQELPVYFAYEYGDYWGSVVASEVTEVNEQTLVYSAYHQRMAIPKDGEDVDEDDDTKTKCAIVLG